jgi:undecaprenyl phosphate-alpha-L-ara4FN deformylase
MRHRALSSSRSVPTPAVGKHASLSPSRYYDLVTRLYGLLLPAPDIGVRGADRMRQARDAGFEVGIHAWNRVRWEKLVPTADNAWIEAEMEQASRRFAAVFGAQAQAHAAPGWRMNRHALRLTQRLGFCYASDCRGNFPFIPVVDGELVHCPQVPTTLPTLDELLVTAKRLLPPRQPSEFSPNPPASTATTYSPCAPSLRE